MEIDWKALAKSPGYMSLKASCVKDVTQASRQKRPMRVKEEFYTLFRWVIARAQHYAHRKDVSIESVLNTWEGKRNYWWLNFYGESRQPKLPSGRPRNVKWSKAETHIRKRFKGADKSELLPRLRAARLVTAKSQRQTRGKSQRWDRLRKQRAANMREYLKEKAQNL